MKTTKTEGSIKEWIAYYTKIKKYLESKNLIFCFSESGAIIDKELCDKNIEYFSKML